jgi:hypothetical protein
VIDSELLPSPDEVAHFREHGWYLTRRVFTDAELDAAIDGSERYYASLDAPEVALPNGRTFRPMWWQGAGEDVLRKNDYTTPVVPELAALLRKPVLGAIAALLAGDDVRLWHDQLLYKPPSTVGAPQAVGWHTDRGYWKTCSSDDLLTAWVPFTDIRPDMGPLQFVDGSLHWPPNDHLDFFSSDLDALEARFETGGAPVVKVPALLRRGQVSFHHCRTIHGSGANTSDRPRRAIALHLQPAANRYVERRTSNGYVHRHDLDDLTRGPDGPPDYADPVFCPRVGTLADALRARDGEGD